MKRYLTIIPKPKAMKRSLLLITVLLASSQLLKAQQGFGNNSPDKSAVVDMSAANKGALLPRVALTGTTDVTTIANPANALTVFNTATAGTAPNNVIPGYYFYSTSLNKWVKLVTTEEVKPDYKIQSNSISYNHFTSDAGFNGLGQFLGGTANIALGFYSMSNSAFAANGNTALGYNAARSLTSGGYNVAVGAGAGVSLGVGSNNVMVGTQTMESLGAGDYNTVLGHDAMRYTTLNSNYNTTVGGQTLFSMQGGTNNTALGFLAGGHLSSGNGNVYIGTQAGNPIPLAGVNESNQLYINNGPGTNALIRGDFATKELTINNTLKVTGLNSAATVTTGNRPVVVDNDGKLMIGTSSPDAWSTNGNAGTNPSANFIGTTDAQSMAFRTNNAEHMRLADYGYLGIGTTGPQNKLHVVNTVAAGQPIPDAIAVFQSNTNTFGLTNESNAEIQVIGRNGSNNRGVTLGIGKPSIYGEHDNGYLNLGSNGSIWTNTAGIFKFSNQKGITLNGNAYPGFEFYNDRSDNQDAYTFYSAVPSLNGTLMRIKAAATAGNGNLLSIEGGQAGANVVVDKNGKLGIGTATPNSTLQVNGSMSANIVTITADYTATADDYTIMVRPTVNGDITITLPAAAANKGRLYHIKGLTTNSGLLTIDAKVWGNQIGPYQDNITDINLIVQSDGVEWVVIQR